MEDVCMVYSHSISLFACITYHIEEHKSRLLFICIYSIPSYHHDHNASPIPHHLSIPSSTHRSIHSFTHSCTYNSAWKEWSSLKAEYPLLVDVLKIIRLNAHKGTGYAKNVGFDKVPYQWSWRIHHSLKAVETTIMIGIYLHINLYVYLSIDLCMYHL